MLTLDDASAVGDLAGQWSEQRSVASAAASKTCEDMHDADLLAADSQQPAEKIAAPFQIPFVGLFQRGPRSCAIQISPVGFSSSS